MTLRTQTCSFVGDAGAFASKGVGRVIEVDGDEACTRLLADSRWKTVAPGSVDLHETMQILLYNDERYFAIRMPRPKNMPYVPEAE